MTKSRQILLASRPTGTPTLENFKIVEIEIPSLEQNNVLVKSLYLSVDPYMRGRMSEMKSYIPPFKVNEVITGGVVGQVIDSKYPGLKAGDHVLGMLGWQDYSTVHGSALTKIDSSQVPISTYLSVVGMPGLTAYFGLLDIGKPKAGETVVISGASGAVGTIVGQIAKLKGCQVVGIAGSDEKTRYLVEELGFDRAINYKNSDNLKKELEIACPNGIDIYFENVGGTISDTVIQLLNPHARIPLCGQISLYNMTKPELGPRLFPILLVRRILLRGFIVSDYKEEFPHAIEQLVTWVSEGKLKYRETITEGLENLPLAFIGLFKGENIGKQLVKVG